MGESSRRYCVHAVYYSNCGAGSARDRSSRTTTSSSPPPPADAQQAISLKNPASNILPTQSPTTTTTTTTNPPPTNTDTITTLPCPTLKEPVVAADRFKELAVSWNAHTDINDKGIEGLSEYTPYSVAYRETSSGAWTTLEITGNTAMTIDSLSDDTSYTSK